MLSAEGICESVRLARRSVQNLVSMGYEAVEVERGQEKLRWFHGIRLHSFVVLKLRHASSGKISFARLEWGSRGLTWTGPVSDEGLVRKGGGVFYPFLRAYRPIANPADALARLDDVILRPMQERPRTHSYSTEDFNCCHVGVAIEELLAADSQDRVKAQSRAQEMVHVKDMGSRTSKDSTHLKSAAREVVWLSMELCGQLRG